MARAPNTPPTMGPMGAPPSLAVSSGLSVLTWLEAPPGLTGTTGFGASTMTWVSTTFWMLSTALVTAATCTVSAASTSICASTAAFLRSSANDPSAIPLSMSCAILATLASICCATSSGVAPAGAPAAAWCLMVRSVVILTPSARSERRPRRTVPCALRLREAATSSTVSLTKFFSRSSNPCLTRNVFS